ncbi:MAG: hypothetical protein K8F91_26360, partial [Candidatus Obscuribacterales bacterium]|nr:hypothetical protein [Candidatus Obscuribacterales bacterium]
YLVAMQTAADAGNSTSYPSALSLVESTANKLSTSGFGQFGKLQPAGGFNGCGVDLFATQENSNDGTTTTSGANSPLSLNPDVSNNIYSFDTVATFDVGPFVNMSAMPFIGDIPGVGKPARLTLSASRIIEHPESIADSGFGSQTGPPAGGSGPIGSMPNPGNPPPGGGGPGPTIIPPGAVTPPPGGVMPPTITPPAPPSTNPGPPQVYPPPGGGPTNIGK